MLIAITLIAGALLFTVVIPSEARAKFPAPSRGTPVAAMLQGSATGTTSADSLQKKVDWLAANGNQPHPDRRPTIIYDAEVDAYMNSGRLKVPAGISQIHLTTTVGEAVATAKIDFDKLTAKERQQNPLWELFSGVHDVKVRCGVWGKDGMGNVNVQNVWLDGHEIPRAALEFFLEHYLKPRLPQASLANRFKMPARIDSAIVGNGKTTLYQK